MNWWLELTEEISQEMLNVEAMVAGALAGSAKVIEIQTAHQKVRSAVPIMMASRVIGHSINKN